MTKVSNEDEKWLEILAKAWKMPKERALTFIIDYFLVMEGMRKKEKHV